MLVVIALIAVLASLLFPALSRARNKARRASCLNNLRQINLAMRQYWDDHDDFPPGVTNSATARWGYWTGYKTFIRSYLGLTGTSSPQDKLFACPADRFYHRGGATNAVMVSESAHQQAEFNFASYWSNAGALTSATNAPGLKGVRISTVREPTRTILVAEMPAFFPYSWHEPRPHALTFNDAKNVVSFVDGHVSYIKIYWKSVPPFSMQNDPPAGYEYRWSGN